MPDDQDMNRTVVNADAKVTNANASRNQDKVALPMSLIKALRRKGSGSGSSNGSGNNSDNSALISIGNTSFGFNFDCDEGMMNSSPPNSDKNGGSDSEGNGSCDANQGGALGANNRRQPVPQPAEAPISYSSHEEAAAAAVANLQSIASSYRTQDTDMQGTSIRKSMQFFGRETSSPTGDWLSVDSSEDEETRESSNLKRKAEDKGDNDSCGYKTDDEDDDGVPGQDAMQQSRGSSPGTLSGPQHVLSSSSINMNSVSSSKGSGKKKKKVDENKREERNAREKERSFRISKQINELRNLLSSGGVIVPKGTKSSVLTEAANYIRVLQNHQYRSEIDRHQLVQQVQMIGSGALGPQAAQVIRHVAAQNGVWSLGNFGGVPPRSAMSCYQPPQTESQDTTAESTQDQDTVDASLRAKIDEHEYRLVFNSCAVGMAIASMGGAFIDCNQLFCQLSNFSKQEVCSMTIFNLTARQDLQHAFDLISQMISPPLGGNPKPCVLRGAMKNRDDLGLAVNLVKGEDGIAKCFCVSLIKNPASPYDTSKPVPATPDLIQIQATNKGGAAAAGINSSPAFTSG